MSTVTKQRVAAFIREIHTPLLVGKMHSWERERTCSIKNKTVLIASGSACGCVFHQAEQQGLAYPSLSKPCGAKQ